MPTPFANNAALSAVDTTAYTDFSLAQTTDAQRLWILSKASVATVGTNILSANPAGRWIAAAGLLAMPWAGVLYVSTSGSDSTGTRNDASKPYLTIQAALNAAQTGDTIWVGPGTFSSGSSSTVWPNTEGLTLRGMGPEATKMTSSSAASVPTLTIPSTATVVVQNATIQDIEIEKTDTSSTTNACFFADVQGNPLLAGANGLVMRNVKFTRNAPAGAGAGYYDACSLSQVNRFAMINCSGQLRAFNCGEGYVVNCRIYGQGDVFGGLITNWSNPSSGIVTLLNAKQRYVSCVIKGSAANSVPGIQIGGAPVVDFDAGCQVEDGIGNNGSLTRYSAALVPNVRFRGQVSGNINLTYSGATNAGVFNFDQMTHTSGTNTWSSSSVRQAVTMRDANLTTISPGARIDLNIRKSTYTSFSGTIGANGATVDRDVEGTTLTMAGGTANFSSIFPWPTGATVRLSATMTTAASPNACRATITAAIVGPQAATGTVAVVCGAGTDTVDVEITRTG